MYSDIYVSRLLSILFCFISIISRCLCRAVEYLWTIYTMLINKISVKNFNKRTMEICRRCSYNNTQDSKVPLIN